MHTTYVQGLPKGTNSQQLESILEAFYLKVFDNFSWLKPDELVLIKPAVNSNDPYPATTHPLAVKVLAKLIKRHEGVPIVGDQSGIEYVQHNQNGVVQGSTLACMQNCGIKIADARYVGFEQDKWDDFVHFTHPKAANWPNGFYITPWIKKADHIINLPRISTHGQAGITLGAKNWVGILRQDSRQLFHAQGPLNWYINYKARKSGLHANSVPGLDFFEMITEIQLAIASKLRGSVFIGTKAQDSLGPNKFLMQEMGINMFRSHVTEPETGVLIGSTDPVAADAVALAFLVICQEQLPGWDRLLQDLLITVNGQIKRLDSYSVWNHPFIAHGLNLGLGGRFDSSNKLVIDNAPGVGERLEALTK